MIDYMTKFCLKGKNAVVTGGCGLIGKEVVVALAQSGAHVLIADIDKKKGIALVKALNKMDLDVEYRYFDISRIKDLKRGVNFVAKCLGGIDIWVNAAYPRTKDWGAKLEDVEYGSFRKNVDMQLISYALTSKYAAENMKKNGGSIINFSSIYGIVASDFTIYKGTDLTTPFPYALIKAGVVNMGRYLASYFGNKKIRVNTVCPGGVFNKQDPKFVKNYSRKVPLKRMAKVEEIAPTVIFLASDASSYITGATIMVDGGWTAI